MKKIFPLFAVIIVLVLAVCSFHIIPTGYTGVKTSFGQIKETTMPITKPSSRSPLHSRTQIDNAQTRRAEFDFQKSCKVSAVVIAERFAVALFINRQWILLNFFDGFQNKIALATI